MFTKILIANRGEIACRIIKTARRMGIATVAVHSDADRDALHVRLADEAVGIGAPRSYLDIARIVAAARDSGSQAVHPGYGFLSENADFADAVVAAGLVFIGPSAQVIRQMGDKVAAKSIAAAAGVTAIPGHGLVTDVADAMRAARDLGYPVMVKASAGGGGKGMRVAWNDTELDEGLQSARAEATASFGDGRVFIEKFLPNPRHIEVQVLADAHGNCVHLFERECSIQRRNQKVIEEAPSALLDTATRHAMGEQACALARAVGYVNAGTVEFIVDEARNFHFIEMNTRLQVEHPVTEMITGVDLVEQMIRIAAGEALPFAQGDLQIDGWAMESRIYAEDPYRNFLPSTGRLTRFRTPEGARVDTGVEEGGDISVHYDPMITKLCTHGATRDRALDRMRTALDLFEIEGIGHNLPFLSAVMQSPRFAAARITTAFLAEEYPTGFSGAAPDHDTLRRIATIAASMHQAEQARRLTISGRMEMPVPRLDWIVTVAGQRFEVSDAPPVDWQPGQRLVRSPLAMKVEPITDGFRLRLRGADLRVHVRSPRAAELAALMPERKAPDTSRLLLCPMPGLIVHINVAEGDEVQEGQPLATVEAMKMENILRAGRSGKVGRISAKAGTSLKVDDLILEFVA